MAKRKASLNDSRSAQQKLKSRMASAATAAASFAKFFLEHPDRVDETRTFLRIVRKNLRTEVAKFDEWRDLNSVIEPSATVLLAQSRQLEADIELFLSDKRVAADQLTNAASSLRQLSKTLTES